MLALASSNITIWQRPYLKFVISRRPPMIMNTHLSCTPCSHDQNDNKPTTQMSTMLRQYQTQCLSTYQLDPQTIHGQSPGPQLKPPYLHRRSEHKLFVGAHHQLPLRLVQFHHHHLCLFMAMPTWTPMVNTWVLHSFVTTSLDIPQSPSATRPYAYSTSQD